MSQHTQVPQRIEGETADADRACAEMKAHLASAKRMVEQARRAFSEPIRQVAEPKSFDEP